MYSSRTSPSCMFLMERPSSAVASTLSPTLPAHPVVVWTHDSDRPRASSPSPIAASASEQSTVCVSSPGTATRSSSAVAARAWLDSRHRAPADACDSRLRPGAAGAIPRDVRVLLRIEVCARVQPRALDVHCPLIVGVRLEVHRPQPLGQHVLPTPTNMCILCRLCSPPAQP